jgi:tRNA 2-thiouridine synthesizing protein A
MVLNVVSGSFVFDHKEQKVLENALWLLMYNVQTFENGRSALSGGNTPSFTDEWDAGQMGCGELVMLLAGRMKALAAGQVLKLVALDSGAQEDIPAWCRMTGHSLVSSTHPNYFIQRRQDKLE